jgi:hypothetical protein
MNSDRAKHPQCHPDSDGTVRWWIWTHRMPLAIEGRNRDKRRTWHAFSTQAQAEDYRSGTEAYAHLSGEVGVGLPPQDLVDGDDYVHHYEPWE